MLLEIPDQIKTMLDEQSQVPNIGKVENLMNMQSSLDQMEKRIEEIQ